VKQNTHIVEWPCADGLLRAYEPTPLEAAAAAPLLAPCYNNTYNRSMMAHAGEMSVEEVAAHFLRIADEGGRPFLLEREGVLMGDADLRHIEADQAEFAILIGERAAQGKGLGQRFATMIHVLAYEGLGLERVYVTIIPANRPSQRLFQKLGYEPDDSPAARSYIDEEEDLTFSLRRARFRELHATPLSEIRFTER
jgi:RimJ/RimL family protein N-acetyltransferase